MPLNIAQIALGGNVGDVRTTFQKALRQISDRELRVVTVSRLFETPPMGVAAGGTFLNAAATIETTLPPIAVLARLQEVENALGRVRTTHWGPRVVDLDLILFGNHVVESHELRVPHLGVWYRRFVLDPLAEIAGPSVHPETGETIAALQKRLLARPLKVAVEGDAEPVARMKEAIGRDFAAVRLVAADSSPVIRFLVGGRDVSAIDRAIGVPADEPGVLLIHAVLTAALGVPEPVGTLS